MMRAGLVVSLCCLLACGPKERTSGDDDDDGTDGPGGGCALQCSEDTHEILDCNGNLVSECSGNTACDSGLLTCVDACTAAETNKRSVGCEYQAISMDVATAGYCFAAFVANTWTSPVKISVKYQGVDLPVANFVRLPVGSGPGLTYAPYDPAVGLAPNEVAILFLSGGTGASPLCPVGSAIPDASVFGTGLGNTFQIQTDVPVVAYQINPYGGGSAAVTAGSLLLPTSAWDTEYIAVNVSPSGIAGNPSMNIIAKEDNTVATITPVTAINGGPGVSGGPAGQPFNITLQKGQQVQITQAGELTGSVVTADKPIGFMAGQPCMNMPTNVAYCDHGEQMVPPVRALGNKSIGVMYRPRVGAETKTFWRIIGAVDGTTLTWSSSVGGPVTLDRGQAIQFETGTPFTVTSQDADHPFMLFTYMSGSQYVSEGFGDPDFVYNVPPAQYLKQYVFFTDPTYPETNLVITRARGADGQFRDVTLDCLGPVLGWQAVDADLEFARVDLVTGNFQPVGACSTGRREIRSDAPFGLQVWGWGTPNTTDFTANVSYGYPGGMNVKPINDVVLQ